MIYTGYFATVKSHPRVKSGELIPVSIARWGPVWFKGETMDCLKPPHDLLTRYKNGLIDEETYEKEYRSRVLANLNPEEVILAAEAKVLCCWEATNKFCHRHIVAKWLRETTGTTVEEL